MKQELLGVNKDAKISSLLCCTGLASSLVLDSPKVTSEPFPLLNSLSIALRGGVFWIISQTTMLVDR